MIDQATGLPIIDPSGVIQQIPLGLPVVPFADLNALGRPTRAPIYPDDFIPTVSMLVGQDDKGAARAGTMDSERNLWTRDVQLQSYGKTLEDGKSGPIDVNVSDASGASILSPQPIVLDKFSNVTGTLNSLITLDTFPVTSKCILYGFEWSLAADPAVVTGSGLAHFQVYTQSTLELGVRGALVHYGFCFDNTSGKGIGLNHQGVKLFPIPIDLAAIFEAGTSAINILLQCGNIAGFHFYYQTFIDFGNPLG